MAKSNKKKSLDDLKGITITQSNRLSSAKYEYSVLQERVFNLIMYHLQVYVKQVMDGKAVHQLDLFAVQQQNTHLVQLPLYYITTPDHYNDVRQVCEHMATIPIIMSDPEKRIRKVTGMIASVQTSYNDKKRVNKISLELRNDVTALLLHIDRNHKGQPSQYTQYQLAAVMQFRNKYSAKIYKYLSSWKNRGGVTMTIEELRELLALPAGRYTNFNDLKRFILLPVQKELKEIADLWYNCAAKDFAETGDRGKKVQHLNFKIIVPVSEEFIEKKIQSLKWALTTQWKCTPAEIKQLLPYLNADTDFDAITAVLDKCYIYRQDNHISHLAAYITRALLNALRPEP